MPEWVSQHRKKGTEVHRRGNNFYLCKVRSVWDKKAKRARKITGEYLGKITEGGVIPPRHKRLVSDVTIKEYGISTYLRSLSEDIESNLKEYYPDAYKEVFLLSLFRLTNRSPLKRFGFYYNTSYLSESHTNVRTSGRFLGQFLRDIGSRRGPMADFMKEFLIGSEFAAIDMTEIFTFSGGVNAAMIGHNKKKVFLPQVNLLLIFSIDKMRPGFFRMLPGSVRDISTITRTVQELGLKDIVLIGDKGFGSDNNTASLSDSGLQYVLPLKRNSSLIDYEIIRKGSRREFDGVFKFKKRHIWHYEKREGEERIIIFLDEKLKAEESATLVSCIERLREAKESGETLEKIDDFESRLYEEDYKQGTIAVRTTCNKPAKKIYELLKSRIAVEKSFDIFKNILNSDRSYMRDDSQVQGFLFVSFIGLLMYYKVYAKLLEHDLLSKYSVMDVVEYLKRVQVINIDNDWQFAEVPKKSRDLLEDLEAELSEKPITKNG